MRPAEVCLGSKNRKSKKSTEPFIKIGSDLLSSPAYIDLSFSARAMLVEMVHFFNGRNNGSIWVSQKTLYGRGFSKNTATNALKELRSHGFLYMTRRGGNITGGCSWYALTWLPINRMEGQQLGAFVSHAYRKWQTAIKNKGSVFGAVQTQNLGLNHLMDDPRDFSPHINHKDRLKYPLDLNPRICDL